MCEVEWLFVAGRILQRPVQSGDANDSSWPRSAGSRLASKLTFSDGDVVRQAPRTESPASCTPNLTGGYPARGAAPAPGHKRSYLAPSTKRSLER